MQGFLDFGLLWGDGITADGIELILETFTTNAVPGTRVHPIFAAENFIFGMGGGLATVDMHRDTSKYAIKCSSITVVEDNMSEGYIGDGFDYKDIDVYKDPITDPGKASKRGKRTTWYDTEAKEYIDGVVGEQPNMHCVNALVLVYLDGELFNQPTMDTIRAAA